jgi:oxygen-independent coproporphyrinogen-3 oxidase
MIKAICQEIFLQQNYLSQKKIFSIYLGGGTPSLLQENELEMIFETIKKYFEIDKNAEITLEANPDDITLEKLNIWKNIGINRLSIGVQTFENQILTQLNRIHNAEEAKNSVILAQKVGFQNITIDLMYALPHQNNAIWQKDLEKAIQLNVPHISAYCLTIEEKTTFGKWVKQKKMIPIQEEIAAQQFEILVETLEKNNYEQYEISNFAQNQQYAKHNTHYWKQGEYLGIGASAHSYNGKTRQFNAANNTIYIDKINQNEIPATIDFLTENDHINEYLLTGLRTIWGVNLEKIKKERKVDFFALQKNKIENFAQQNLLYYQNQHLFLTQKGKILADEITSQLFL